MIEIRCNLRRMLVAGWLLGAASPARALDASDILSYNVGRVVLRPHLVLAEQYNDNLFYQSQIHKSDLVTVVRPSLEARLGRLDGDNYVQGTYTLDYLAYAENSPQNSLDHRLAFASQLKGARLRLVNEDSAHFMSSIYGGQATFQQGGQGQALGSIDRVSYALDHRVSYTISERTQPYLAANYWATDFSRGVPLIDLNTWRGTVGFDYRALTKTWFFGETYYGQSAAGPNMAGQRKGPHADSVGGYLGARGSFTSRLSGSVKGGYEESTYANGLPASSSPVGEASLDWRAWEKTTFSLGYSRRSSFSVQNTQQTVTTDLMTLRARQRLGSQGRLVAMVSGSYGQSEFSGAGRSDDWFRAGLDLTYQYRLWLGAGLSYEHEQLVSSINSVDYQVNRVTLSVVVGY